MKPHIIHYPEKMICHRVVNMILQKKNYKTITDHIEDDKKNIKNEGR